MNRLGNSPEKLYIHRKETYGIARNDHDAFFYFFIFLFQSHNSDNVGSSSGCFYIELSFCKHNSLVIKLYIDNKCICKPYSFNILATLYQVQYNRLHSSHMS